MNDKQRKGKKEIKKHKLETEMTDKELCYRYKSKCKEM